ncbi:Uu.00g058470.m01.CDS01 [Anthostomella pinea]|uniref:Uu.00g058470.m01.CDS01 n=1 Tax=Anthostomella pinea TaxID=933095 RepID=A0AAI8YM85_9PEZI|nr:Uu.00g058470.m01.CDS01 [Anthostomella pinea]
MASTEKRKQVLFDDSDDESDGGADLKINDEYAKRFKHNKEREELHRLEEKYKSNKPNGNNSKDADDDDDDSSSDETEDENGFLATAELDSQISATLQAIKAKDPRVYDGKTTFYAPVDEDADATATTSKPKKEKPVYLQDYHREKILRGDIGADDDDQEEPAPTFAQEQDSLKKSIQDEIRAQLKGAGEDEESDSDGDFIKAKEETRVIPANSIHPSRAQKVKVAKPDIAIADKDPELYLSNFLASRAWAEGDDSGWQAFESDEDEDEKADQWEAAYNLRFEDPSKSNEVLKSYARDVVAARSVRREDKSGRKRQRELEREAKEAEKRERKEERARLRRLKADEAENKLQKIKKAAGIRGQDLKDEDWQKFLQDAWENDKWEEEMNKTFNDQYYAQAEAGSEDDEDDGTDDGSKKPKKVKKPKWDDDVDIKDLVPDFEEEERPNITLTDIDENDGEDDDEDGEDDDGPAAKRQKTTKDRKKERLASQKAARQERAKLEALVDARMDIDEPEVLAGSSSSKKTQGGSRFMYRDTRPESFGLTTNDILMASDADLNTFAGLKKLAHFRDPEKLSKDRKKLGKKARLRQWRKDTFGPEFEREPPAFHPGGSGPGESSKPNDSAEDSNIVEGGSKKKRKRSRNKKSKGAEAEAGAA